MSNNYNFNSIFKDELNYFIKFKRSLGLKYEGEVYRLKKIDSILHDLNLHSKKIDKETFYALTKRDNMQEADYARKYGVTKDFCKFLISNEYKDIYYEERKIKIINNYKPIIFDNNQIVLLFETMNTYIKLLKNRKFYNLYYTYSIMLRLIYACGLRLSEVIKLNIEDIDFKENTISIINSKRNVSRLVVFSNTMKKCLEDYLKKCNVKNGLLFKNTKNKQINKNYLRKYYKQILKEAQLNTNAHIHDLRHCFANVALNQMLEKGYEENVVIVYLYKYMGHNSITETEYYLHFTDYNKRKLITKNDTFSKKLYEGVEFDNE